MRFLAPGFLDFLPVSLPEYHYIARKSATMIPSLFAFICLPTFIIPSAAVFAAAFMESGSSRFKSMARAQRAAKRRLAKKVVDLMVALQPRKRQWRGGKYRDTK